MLDFWSVGFNILISQLQLNIQVLSTCILVCIENTLDPDPHHWGRAGVKNNGRADTELTTGGANFWAREAWQIF